MNNQLIHATNYELAIKQRDEARAERDAGKALVAEALAVFDLMLVGCTVPNFADYQNGDGEEIGARMDALHAALKAGQAAPIQSGDVLELIERLTDYANDPGYSHGDYADTMKQAAAALSKSGDVRNQALEEAATYLADVHSIGLADEIRALACNAPSIKEQGVPAMSVPEDDYSGPVLQNEAEINYAEGWNACLAALASTPSAAMQGQGVQPQAGGRELTDAVIAVARVLADRSADACNVDREDNWKFYSDDFMAEAKAAIDEYHRITGTKGATE